jgi:hypothetical protein
MILIILVSKVQRDVTKQRPQTVRFPTLGTDLLVPTINIGHGCSGYPHHNSTRKQQGSGTNLLFSIPFGEVKHKHG